LARGGLVLADRVAALLDHLLQHGQHLGVVELDALVHLALLDGGVHQADDAEAGLVAGLHGRLHVFGEALLEAHRGGSGSVRHEKPATLARAGFTGRPGRGAQRAGGPDQYRRWRLVTSREVRRAWRFTAAAALRLRSWVGFS